MLRLLSQLEKFLHLPLSSTFVLSCSVFLLPGAVQRSPRFERRLSLAEVIPDWPVLKTHQVRRCCCSRLLCVNKCPSLFLSVGSKIFLRSQQWDRNLAGQGESKGACIVSVVRFLFVSLHPAFILHSIFFCTLPEDNVFDWSEQSLLFSF